MTIWDITGNDISPFTGIGVPIAQRFKVDPELFTIACEEGCADMTDAELADMDAEVARHREADRIKEREQLDRELDAIVAGIR